jgi:protein SCO1/2
VNAGDARESIDIDPLRQPAHTWAVLACLIIVPIGCSDLSPPPVMAVLPNYELIDSQRRPFGSEHLAGRVYVANFFFTRCTTMCPMLTRSMSSLLRRYREQELDGIHLVSISVDGEYDTPKRLSEYAERHAIDAEAWTLLTGTPEQLRALVVEGFRVPLGGPEEDEHGLMDIAHAGRLVLVDGSGQVRGYHGSDERSLDEIFRRSQLVLAEEHPPRPPRPS